MTERIDRMGLSQKISVLRHLAPPAPSPVLNPEKYTSLHATFGYPPEIYEAYEASGQDPVQKATEALMLGILADNGILHQIIGDAQRSITLENFVPVRCAQFHPLVKVTDATSRFIAEKSSILPTEPSQLNLSDWYMRSVRLQQLFSGEAQDLLVLKTDGEDFPITSLGIDTAWANSSLPKFYLGDGSGPRIFDVDYQAQS